MDEEIEQERMFVRPSRHQRGEVRDSMLLQARLRPPGDDCILPLRVRNISAGGLMAECTASFVRGAAVEVELRNVGWVAGTVAWVAGGRLGITFGQRIDPQLARKPVGTGTGAGESMIIKRPSGRTRRPGLRIE